MSGRWLRDRSVHAILVLSLGALLFGLLAWRESRRAEGTAELLMKDYASFVAEKLAREAAALRVFTARETPLKGEPEDSVPPRLALLRFFQARDTMGDLDLPEPRFPGVRYFFHYERASRRLELSGAPPPEAELEQLRAILDSYAPACGSHQLVSFGQLRSLAPASIAAVPREVEWSGWVQTGGQGEVRRVAGARFDDEEIVARYLRPLIENEDCACPTMLLPESLASVGSNRRAASFEIRDGRGVVRYRSEPWFENASRSVRALSGEIPLSGWTVAVSVNPKVVEPLLPFGGRDVPWLALAFLFTLIAASAGLAIHAHLRGAELLRVQQDFISNVSHELRTPLTRIRLFNELLLDGKQASFEKRSLYRRVIDRECRRLGFLVDNILDLSRHRRGTLRYDMAPLDLRHVVDEGLDAFRSASERGRYTIEEHLEDVPAVLGDADALQQVLVNLLDNAVKYSPAGSRVEVGLAARDGAVELLVRDEGPGIPLSEHDRIFEEFHRLETGDCQRVAGSGIGLALVRRIVDAHRGRVRLSSEPGKGSVFIVELPTADGAPT